MDDDIIRRPPCLRITCMGRLYNHVAPAGPGVCGADEPAVLVESRRNMLALNRICEAATDVRRRWISTNGR